MFVEAFQLLLSDPFWVAVRAAAAQARHARIDDELLAAMDRWEVLGAR